MDGVLPADRLYNGLRYDGDDTYLYERIAPAYAR